MIDFCWFGLSGRFHFTNLTIQTTLAMPSYFTKPASERVFKPFWNRFESQPKSSHAYALGTRPASALARTESAS